MAHRNNQGFLPNLEALEDRLSLTTGLTNRLPTISQFLARHLTPSPPIVAQRPNHEPAYIFNPTQLGPSRTITVFNPTKLETGIPIRGLAPSQSSPPASNTNTGLTVIFT